MDAFGQPAKMCVIHIKTEIVLVHAKSMHGHVPLGCIESEMSMLVYTGAGAPACTHTLSHTHTHTHIHTYTPLVRDYNWLNVG